MCPRIRAPLLELPHQEEHDQAKDDTPVEKQLQRAEHNPSDGMSGSLGRRMGADIANAQNAQNECDGTEEQANTWDEAEDAAVVGEEGPGVFVGNDRRDRLVALLDGIAERPARPALSPFAAVGVPAGFFKGIIGILVGTRHEWLSGQGNGRLAQRLGTALTNSTARLTGQATASRLVSKPERTRMHVHSDWLLTAERAAIHQPTATAVIADLHLGYNEARQRGGEAVPRVRLNDLLTPLVDRLVVQQVRRLVIAGDLFEDARSDSVASELLDWLGTVEVELAGVVPGNHDRGLEWGASRLPTFPEGIRLGRWRVVHGDGELPAEPLVLGHFHPCLRWERRLTAPCYLVGPDRLVLPAFSADAAGVNVLGQNRWRCYRAYAIAGDKVLDFGEIRKVSSEW